MPQHPNNIPLGVALAASTFNADTQIKTGAGVLMGFSVITAGTTWVVAAYDGTSAAGNELYTFTAAAGPVIVPPTRFTTGLFFHSVSGTPGSLKVAYF